MCRTRTKPHSPQSKAPLRTKMTGGRAAAAAPLLCVNPSVRRRHMCRSAHPDQENGTTPTQPLLTLSTHLNRAGGVSEDCLTHRSVCVRACACAQLMHQRSCPSCSSIVQPCQIHIFIKLFLVLSHPSGSPCAPTLLLLPAAPQCRSCGRRSKASLLLSTWTAARMLRLISLISKALKRK